MEAELLTPIGRVSGFTYTLRVAGSVAELELIVSQGAAAAEGETVAVNAGVPVLAFTETDCSDGKEGAPDCQVNVRLLGLAVMVVVVAAGAGSVATKAINKNDILPTPCLSARALRV